MQKKQDTVSKYKGIPKDDTSNGFEDIKESIKDFYMDNSNTTEYTVPKKCFYNSIDADCAIPINRVQKKKRIHISICTYKMVVIC